MRDLERGHYSNKIIRDEPANLKVEDMTTDELWQRLSEYEAGKRNDRDGYIIANQLLFNYQAQKETASPKAQHVQNVLSSIGGKHPEFGQLKDFRLSDKIAFEEKKAAEKKTQTKDVGQWEPPDAVPVRVLVNGKRAVGVFQYRLEFWKIPDAVEVTRKGNRAEFTLANRSTDPRGFPRIKARSFRHPVETLPRDPDFIGPNLLACTMMLFDYYQPMTTDERRKVALRTGRRALKWTNSKAGEEQICSVLSVEGSVVAAFPPQAIPGTLYYPLEMSADGNTAAVMVGERVLESGEEGSSYAVGKPRFILEWSVSTGITKRPIKDHALSRFQVLTKYAAGEL